MLEKTKDELEFIDDAFNSNKIYLEVGYHLISSFDIYVITNIFVSKENKILVEFQNIKTNKVDTLSVSDYMFKRYEIFSGSLLELDQQVKLTILNSLDNNNTNVISKEVSIPSNNKTVIIEIKKRAIIESQNLEAISKMMQNKLEALRNKTNGEITKIKNQIDNLDKAIHTVELYLGIEETIQHIKTGLMASDLEPLKLIQSTVFMDELVGDPTDDGFELKDINKFFQWMLEICPYYKFERFNLFLPYQKCICILRVRRYEKNRQEENIFVKIEKANEDMLTFLFIRNGENISVLSTDINFGTKLFPSPTEFLDITKDPFRGQEKLEKIQSSYKNKFIVLQGINDRTDLFGNIKYNFLNSESINNGSVVLVYDTELISNGSRNFKEFITKLRNNIDVGSRIMITNLSYNFNSDYNDRYLKNVKYPFERYGFPSDEEVYIVEELGMYYYSDMLKISFLSKKEKIWDEKLCDFRSPKNKIGFYLYRNEIISVDTLRHDDFLWLESVLYDRQYRKSYLSLIPTATIMYKFLKKEMEIEHPFIQMLIGVTKKTEKECIDAVYWWKNKNKWKRPLTKDDSQAYRMIIKHLEHSFKCKAS